MTVVLPLRAKVEGAAHRAIALMLLLVAACSARQRSSPTAVPIAAPKQATAALASTLRNPIPAGQAVVFMIDKAPVSLFGVSGDGDTPGPHARPVARLAEGQLIGYLEMVNAYVGATAQTWAKVSHDGRHGLVRNRALITEDRLHRSPRSDWVVFSAVSACHGEDEACSADSWLLRVAAGPAQRATARYRIAKDGSQLSCVSWRPDGKAVALGLETPGKIHVIALETFTPRQFEMDYLAAPAYGPDGSLYARGGTRSVDDAVYQLLPDGKARLLLEQPGTHFGTDPDHEPWETPPAPPQVSFDAQSQVIEALFYRADHQLTVRMERDGRVISRRRRPSK